MKDKRVTVLCVVGGLFGIMLLLNVLCNAPGCGSNDGGGVGNPNSPENVQRAIDNLVRNSNKKDRQPWQR